MLYSASRSHMTCKTTSASLLNSPPSSQNSVHTALSRRPRPPSYSLLFWVSVFSQRLPGLLCRLPAIPLSFIPAPREGCGGRLRRATLVEDQLASDYWVSYLHIAPPAASVAGRLPGWTGRRKRDQLPLSCPVHRTIRHRLHVSKAAEPREEKGQRWGGREENASRRLS